MGERLAKRFGVRSTPFILILDGDGKEIDRIAGYEPPPEKVMKRLQAILAGTDTVPALLRAMAEDPQDPKPLIKLGVKHQARHDRDKALKLYEEAVRLDPKGTKPMTRESGETVSCKELAEFHHAQTFVTTYGLYDVDAVRDFIRTHPASPLLKDAYTEISRFYRLRDGEGRAFLDEFISKFPNDPDVLKIYIDRILELRNPAEAGKYYSHGLALAERIGNVYPSIKPLEAAKTLAQLAVDSQDPARAEMAFGPEIMSGQTKSWADSLLTYAEFWLVQKRNQADAEASIEKALNLAPGEPEILRRAAAAYHHHLGQPDKALEVYGPDLLPKIADDAQALYSYFKFWMTLGKNVESAEKALAMLLELKPDTVYYRIGAASVYLKPGPIEKSLGVFGPDFIATRQDDAAVLYDYGTYWTMQGLNLESAIPALTKALRASPTLWTKHWGAAQLLVKLKRPELALEVFGPEYLPHIAEDADGLSVYAQFWGEQKTNGPSALEALEMALRIKDLPPWQLSRIAYGFVRAGRPERVDQFFGPEILIKIIDDPLAVSSFAGFWYHQYRNLPAALQAIERACELKKEESRNWLMKARILMLLDRPREALKAIDQAIALDKFGDAKEEQDSFRKLILEDLEKTKR